jgi:hypothetical protein
VSSRGADAKRRQFFDVMFDRGSIPASPTGNDQRIDLDTDVVRSIFGNAIELQ